MDIQQRHHKDLGTTEKQPHKITALRQQTADKVKSLRQSSKIYDVPIYNDFKSILTYLFDLGGVVSGGAVLSVIFNQHIKDVDVYFNNDEAYLKAVQATKNSNKFDICWYFNCPYELHDLTYVQSVMTRDSIKISKEAKIAIDSGISDILWPNVIYPERTAKRMLKYNSKYGVKFKLPQVLAFASVYNIEHSIVDKLVSISV